MDKKRKDRYQDKISNLKRYFNLLEQWFKESDINILKKKEDYRQIFAVYHATQLCIEVISDLCAMIVKDLKFKPNDNYANFKVLHKDRILSDELIDGLNELNGLTNRIVHDYNGLIDDIAWKSIQIISY